MAIKYQVELQNLFERPDGSKTKHPVNGWYVAEVIDGCRGRQWNFKHDEQAARKFAADKNEQG